MWDIDTGKCKSIISSDTCKDKHKGAIYCMQFDDRRLVTGSFDHTIKVKNHIITPLLTSPQHTHSLALSGVGRGLGKVSAHIQQGELAAAREGGGLS